MAFTGKATYTAGVSLPELAEDVSDLVAINSPFETPLLDILGDAARPARSTVHEWLEDGLLPNTDKITAIGSDPTLDTTFTVANASRFRIGDQIRQTDKAEVMLVTAINTSTNVLTIVRTYGGTSATALLVNQGVQILGNASLEGDDAPTARFTTRARVSNYTQIFSSTVEVSGTELAVRQLGVKDELDYQKQQRLRELMRDLENCVINGRAPAANPQGSSTVRRTMRGIVQSVATNRLVPDDGVMPSDDGGGITEDHINKALRHVWESSSGSIDLIVVGGREKRSINSWAQTYRRYVASDTKFQDQVNVYESDYGVCKVVLSRYVPTGTILLLDSSRIEVSPLSGRSFHYKPLAAMGDREAGQLIGEYTLEMRNESAHATISGYSA